MSEYQYYEFQAIDRPLDRDVQDKLRSISSRARITATSFTNHYEWGDLKGDPRKFMELWFDLHLYLANWGTRRLMMRFPKRLLDLAAIDPFLRELDWVKTWSAGENAIIDICPDESESGEDWDDGSGWLATLAPLRADVLSGDFRLFYLLWLMAVQVGAIADDEVEPLPGIGPLTGALQAFADFFSIDGDLVTAAAEIGAGEEATYDGELRQALATLPDDEKIELLFRVAQGDGHVAAELKRRFRKSSTSAPRRTVGALRERAKELETAYERAEAERREAEQRRRAEEAEKQRRSRLEALKKRGESVWGEVEQEIERRIPSGYDRAASLLVDLQTLAAEQGSRDEFARRLEALRARHQAKRKFIERLVALAPSP